MDCHYCKKELTKNEVDNYFNDESRLYCEHCHTGIIERKLDRVDFLIGLYYYCAKNYSGQWSREYYTIGNILNYFDFIRFNCLDIERFFRNNIKENHYMLGGYMLGYKTFYKNRKGN